MDFHDASFDIGEAFKDYNECRSHSTIDYFHSREFGKKFMNNPAFRERFGKKEVEVTLYEN